MKKQHTNRRVRPWLARYLSPLLIVAFMATPAHAVIDILTGAFAASLVARSTVDQAKDAAHEAIADLNQRLKDRIKDGGDRMDGSILLASEQAALRLQQVRRDLDEMIDKTFEKGANERRAFFLQLAEERRAVFEGLDILIARAEGSTSAALDRFEMISGRLMVQGSQEKVALELILRGINIPNAQQIKDQIRKEFRKLLPGGGDERDERFGLYRIYGLGQEYRPTGVYRFVAAGNGFGNEPGSNPGGLTVRANGIPLRAECFPILRDYFRQILVPADLLNSSISDLDPMPITLSFDCPNPRISVSQNATLFPKFPVEYRATATIKNGTTAAAYVTTPGLKFLDWEEASTRTKIARLRKELPAGAAGLDEEVAVRERMAVILNRLIRDRLPLGTFTLDLPPDTVRWQLEVHWPNSGDRDTLTRSHKSGLGIHVDQLPPAGYTDSLEIRVTLPE